MFNKKAQKIMVSIIAVLVALGLIGVPLTSYWMNSSQQPVNTGDVVALMEGQISTLESKAQQNANSYEAWEDVATTYFQLGDYYQGQGDMVKSVDYYEKAAVAFEKSLALEPKNPASRVDMAIAYYYSDQLDKAEQNFKQGITEFPTYAMAHRNYAIFLWQARKDTNGAVSQLQEILKNNPTADALADANALIARIQAGSQGGGAGTGQVDWSQANPGK